MKATLLIMAADLEQESNSCIVNFHNKVQLK